MRVDSCSSNNTLVLGPGSLLKVILMCRLMMTCACLPEEIGTAASHHCSGGEGKTIVPSLKNVHVMRCFCAGPRLKTRGRDQAEVKIRTHQVDPAGYVTPSS